MEYKRKLPGLMLLAGSLCFFATGCEPEREYDDDLDETADHVSSETQYTAGLSNGSNGSSSANATSARSDLDDIDINGDAAFSAVQLSFSPPETLRVGEQAEVPFMLENVSDHPVHMVTVKPLDGSIQIEPIMTQSDRQNSSQQQNQSKDSQSASEKNMLKVGSLAAGESKLVRAYISGSEVGTLEKCFAVDYTPGYCTTIEVVKPELEFQRFIVDGEGKQVEADFICADLYAVYRVRNVGSGESRPVTVMEEFPEGLMIDGDRSLNESIGSLDAGETWEERYALSAEMPVEYKGVAYAKTNETRLKSSEASVDLSEAEIKLTLDGPANHKMFRTAQYQVKVHNTGEVVAQDVVLTVDTDDFSDADLTFDTQLDLDGEEVALGDIGPGENVTIMMSADFDEVGSYTLEAMADGYCVADSQRAKVETMVEGVPALRLEMIDTNDPVIEGETTDYRIQIKNQGTARDTDVSLMLELPQGLEYVSGEGATPVTRNNGKLDFGKVKNLDPGDTVEWTISVRATSSGKVQTTAIMKSKAITSGVREDEPTNVVSR